MQASNQSGRIRPLRTVRAAAVAGMVYAVCASGALIVLLRSPAMTASTAEIRAHYASPTASSGTVGAMTAMLVASFGFLWFVAVIRERIGHGEPLLFSTVFIGTAVLYVALLLTGSAALAAPAALQEVSGRSPDADTAAMMRAFGDIVLGVFASRVQALFMTTTATIGLRTGALPRWLVLTSYAVALGLLVNVTFRTPSVHAFSVWVALVSAVLLIRRRAPVVAR